MSSWTVAIQPHEAALFAIDSNDDIEQKTQREILNLISATSFLQIKPQYDLFSSRLINHSVLDAKSIHTKSSAFCVRPPGLSRGIHFDLPSSFSSYFHAEEPVLINEDDAEPDTPEDMEEEAVDELLLAQPSYPTESTEISVQDEWARHSQATEEEFDQLTSTDPAMTYPFDLDLFQKQAIVHIERGESVFVAAHTSAGKTVVAEYAIALAMKRHFTRAIYTSPIKALSNQKFRDFTETFPTSTSSSNQQEEGQGDKPNVGLVTGDVQINPEASCLIMTTEILRSMLYRNASVVADIEFVIFDEIHYINDASRGVVWEEVIIMLPPTVTIVMLSATTPNTMEFADWVGRTRKQPIHVISTTRRPVPLEHYLFIEGAPTDNTVNSEKQLQLSSPLFHIVHEGLFSELQYKTAIGQRKSNVFNGLGESKSTWTFLINYLKKRQMLPIVAFTFSRRACESNADALSNLDVLGSAKEKAAVHRFMERCVRRLSPADRNLPQILRMREMLARGIAVHHSGLLPLMKEAVEILFSRGLLRVLFATETFAMGVNMPARTVVFSSIRKHDGECFRFLLPGEYTQMAGRAGRRGLDDVGTVIINVPASTSTDNVYSEITLKQVVLGTPTKLASKFRLTYAMILNLLRVQSMPMEEMLRLSFSEHGVQRTRPKDLHRLDQLRKQIQNSQELVCEHCQSSMSVIRALLCRIASNASLLYAHLASISNAKIFVPGRLLVVNYLDDQQSNSIQKLPAALLAVRRKDSIQLTVMILLYSCNSTKSVFASAPLNSSSITARVLQISIEDVAFVTDRLVKIPTTLGSIVSMFRSSDLNVVQDALLAMFQQNLQSHWSDDLFLSNEPHILLPSIKELDLDSARVQHVEDLQNLVRIIHQSNDQLICPMLWEHFDIFNQKASIVDEADALAFTMSDQNLLLLPEYHVRLALLRQMNYVEQHHLVTVKGRVACELNTVNELLATELLFDNFFGSFEPQDCLALLSAMVFDIKPNTTSALRQGEQESEAEILAQQHLSSYPALLEGISAMKTQASRLNQLQTQACFSELDLNVYSKQRSTTSSSSGTLDWIALNFTLVHVVHAWARGVPFVDIVAMTDELEGSIVRCMVRLEETCREVRGASIIMGNMAMAQKMEQASRLIKRDVCFAASLYI